MRNDRKRIKDALDCNYRAAWSPR